MAPRTKPETGEDTSKEDDAGEDQVEEDASEDAADDASEQADVSDAEQIVSDDPETKTEELQKASVTLSGAIPVQGDEHVASEQDLADSGHILDSPQKFGFWEKGKLFEFKKGKTMLTNEQLAACKAHPYVRHNGASILKLVQAGNKVKGSQAPKK